METLLVHCLEHCYSCYALVMNLFYFPVSRFYYGNEDNTCSIRYDIFCLLFKLTTNSIQALLAIFYLVKLL